MISESIKKIIKGYLNKIELPDVEVGRVISIKPLLIQIPEFPEPIGLEFLLIPRGLWKEQSGEEGIPNPESPYLQRDDRVAMVKAKGGQRYLIVNKLEVFNDTKSE